MTTIEQKNFNTIYKTNFNGCEISVTFGGDNKSLNEALRLITDNYYKRLEFNSNTKGMIS